VIWGDFLTITDLSNFLRFSYYHRFKYFWVFSYYHRFK